jgi:hypothetical protein
MDRPMMILAWEPALGQPASRTADKAPIEGVPYRRDGVPPRGRDRLSVLRYAADCLVEACRPTRGLEHGHRVEVVTPACHLSIPDRDDGDEPVVVRIPGLH